MPSILSFILPKDKKLFKYIFTLAFPVIISNISRVMMGLVDTVMVGHLGANAIAAVGMASMVTWTAMSVGIAFRTGTQALVSRRLGQKKYAECGTAFRNMQLFVLLSGIPLTYLCYSNTSSIMSFFIKDTHALQLCIDYSIYIFLSIYFIYVSFVFQGFYTGIEKTKVHMKVVISSNILNFYLNIGLIFGSIQMEEFLSQTIFNFLAILWIPFNFPELGVKGAAIGTLVATIWGCVHYAFYLFKEDIKNPYKVFKNNFDMEMLKRQLIIAYPLAIQEFMVMLSLTIFYKIIALIGIIQLAATQIIFKIMHASFMPAIGIGQACATLVGKYLGEENPDKAEKLYKRSLNADSSSASVHYNYANLLKHVRKNYQMAEKHYRRAIQIDDNHADALGNLANMLSDILDMGVKKISLCDTSGLAFPEDVSILLEQILKHFPELEIYMHLHNTYGRGIMNLIASMEYKIKGIDTSLGGIGGSPFIKTSRGNIATEETVDYLHNNGIETGIDIRKISTVSKIIENMIGESYFTGELYKQV